MIAWVVAGTFSEAHVSHHDFQLFAVSFEGYLWNILSKRTLYPLDITI